MSRAARRGAVLNNVAQEWSNKMAAGVKTSADQPNAPTFTRRFETGPTKRDEMFQLKQKLIDPNTGLTRFGQATFSEEDARYLLQKQAISKEADFDSWFGRNYQTADLPTRRLAETLNPDYYQSREKQMVERAKMALRIKLIKFRGPRDEEDLRILYGLETGDIVLGSNWDRIGDDGAGDDAFNRDYLVSRLNLPARIFAPRDTAATNVNPGQRATFFGDAQARRATNDANFMTPYLNDFARAPANAGPE